MAKEAPVIETKTEPGESVEFGTSLEDIFAKKMPGGLTIDEEESVESKGGESPRPPEQQPPQQKDEPKEKPKAKSKEPASEPIGITDILQAASGGVEGVAESTDDELPKPEIPQELKGKSREHFEKIATEKWEADKKARALEKKAAALEKQLSEAGADPRIQQLQAQLKDYSSRLERVGLEHHPWFEANFTAPRNQLVETAKRAFKDGGGDPEAISKALRLEGQARVEKLDEVLSEISSTSLRGRIERTIDTIDQLDQRKDQILSNRDSVLRSLAENDKITQKQMLEQHSKQTKAQLSEAKELLRDKFGFFVFKTVDDPQFSWWNDEVKKMDTEAENLMLSTTDPKELTLGSYMAVAAPRIMNLLLKEVQNRKKIEKEFAEYKNSEPKLGTGSRKSRAQESQEEEEDKPLVQSILDHIHNNA